MRQIPFDPNLRAEGRDWPMFGMTMVGHRRLDNIQNCVDSVIQNNVPGDLVECGVWRGGSAILMRALLREKGVSDRLVWAADSFEGLPRPDTESYPADEGYDVSDITSLAVSLEEVKLNFARLGLLDDQVKFLKGWFKDTLPKAPIDKIAVLRADGDLYESTMQILENLHHKVTTGGYVIIDDYNSWEPCKQAVNDFRTQNGIFHPIKEIDWTGVYWQVT
jgi:hypothetical protein